MKRLVLPLVAAAVLAVGTTPAWAETTTPADDHDAVDVSPGYQAQRTCAPSPKPGTVALLNLLVERWGGSSWGISRGCGIGGRSEHKEGRALDWHMDVADPADRARVTEALAWLTGGNGELADRLGVMYIIWDQKVWASYRRAEGWRPMPDRGSYTANHLDHVHISLTWDGAMQQTSWWTGVPVTRPLTGPCGVDAAPACRPPTAQAGSAPALGIAEEPIPPESLPEPSDVPLIGGTPRVGHLLQTVPGTWLPEDADLVFQWIRDGIPIPDAHDASYAVTPVDLGSRLRVRVIAFAPDGSVVIRLSDELPAIGPAAFRSAPAPTLLGHPAVGRTLGIDPGSWRPFPATLSFQWYRDGTPITGATGYGYTLGPADAGHRISVRVTAGAPGYQATTTTSAATSPVERATLDAPRPQVQGTRVVGRALTAVPGDWEPAPVALSYQWLRDGRPIPGATRASYRLTAADEGADIRVRVHGTRPGYADATVTSPAGDRVRPANPPASPSPSPTPSATPTEAEPTPTPTPPEPTPTTTAGEEAVPTGSPAPTPSPSAAPEPTPAAAPSSEADPEPTGTPSPSATTP